MTETPPTYNQFAGQRVQRLEAISDGVFAISLTLLVLELHVPVSEAIQTEGEVLASLVALAPKFLAYFLSFLTLGIFWVAHSSQFNVIERSDRNLTWLSLFFLLFITVLPFTTAFLGGHLNSRVAIGFYWLNIFALGVAIWLHWRYAYRHHLLNIESDSERGKALNRAILGRVFTAQTLYALASAVCLVNTYVSIGLIVLIQLNYALGVFPWRKNS